MPHYPFVCDNAACRHPKTKQAFYFEVEQAMNEDHVANCPKCGQGARRVYGPTGIKFNGSGFHVNDYPRR